MITLEVPGVDEIYDCQTNLITFIVSEAVKGSRAKTSLESTGVPSEFL